MSSIYNMREEKLYLADIKEAIDKIFLYTKGLSFEGFEADNKTIDAVMRNFEIIGEATKHLSDETRKGEPLQPWIEIVSMRNMLIHEYFGADIVEVWKTIESDLPSLRGSIIRLLGE